MFVHLFSFQRSVHALLLRNIAVSLRRMLCNHTTKRIIVSITFETFFLSFLVVSIAHLTRCVLLYANTYMCKALFSLFSEYRKGHAFDVAYQSKINRLSLTSHNDDNEAEYLQKYNYKVII